MRKPHGGTFLIIGIPGETIDGATAELIKQTQPSGFILFSRNISNPAQLRDLTDNLRSLVEHEPIITIDEEGGRVSRLKSFMRVPTPSAESLRNCDDLRLVRKHGELTARMLRLLGINLNLAPVLDIELNPGAENSLRTRMFGLSGKAVARNARVFIEGMSTQGVLNCGKHFPGYSAAQVDPHKLIPSIDREIADLESAEWVPFRKLLPRLDTVMTAHIQCRSLVGSDEVATLSSKAVEKVLREDWRYKRCIITDDLDMGAIRNTYGVADAAAMALSAGNDLMLVCHSLGEVPNVARALEGVELRKREQSARRIGKLRKRLVAPRKFSMRKFIELELEFAKLNERIERKLSKQKSKSS